MSHGAPHIHVDSVPNALKARRQWVTWRGVLTKKGRIEKVPHDPKTNPPRLAATDNSASWGGLQQCVDALSSHLMHWRQDDPITSHGGGIGFVFSKRTDDVDIPDDPYCGIDLDHCRDPETGAIEPWAYQLMTCFATYAEVSPSGTGLHLIGQGRLKGPGRKRDPIELYDRKRFFTITGQIVETFRELVDCQQAADWLYVCMDLLAEALKQYGERFSFLFAGIWAEVADRHGKPFQSQSEADLALCSMVANIGADTAQLDSLMRLSGLYRPKWDTKHGAQTYGQMTIAKALQRGNRQLHNQTGEVNANKQKDDGLGSIPIWSDQSNAEALVQRHGKNLRYCHPFKKWLVWDGKHWCIDDTGAAMRLAKQTVKDLAGDLKTVPEDRTKAFLQHIKSSLSALHLRAMVTLTESEPGIPVRPPALDADPWVLNCQNSTLDLQSGQLRPHRRANLITKLVPVDCDPEAQCPTWHAFLDRIMDGNAELIAFLKRAVGYALTGDTSEHVVFICYGTGRNGKSVFIRTIQTLLADYARQAEFTTFLRRKNDSVRNDLAALRGARFVSAIEVAEGRRLDETAIKQVTGQDVITARFLFQEYFEYIPQFKLFLACNHKPVIRGTDTAIWERIRLIPFAVTIPKTERDKALLTKLQTELPGILAWAMQGCLDWHRHGLDEPNAVRQATAGYRQEMDVVGQFMKNAAISRLMRKRGRVCCTRHTRTGVTGTASRR